MKPKEKGGGQISQDLIGSSKNIGFNSYRDRKSLRVLSQGVTWPDVLTGSFWLLCCIDWRELMGGSKETRYYAITIIQMRSWWFQPVLTVLRFCESSLIYGPVWQDGKEYTFSSLDMCCNSSNFWIFLEPCVNFWFPFYNCKQCRVKEENWGLFLTSTASISWSSFLKKLKRGFLLPSRECE